MASVAGTGLTSTRFMVGGVWMEWARARVLLSDGENVVDVGRPVNVEQTFDNYAPAYGTTWVGNTTQVTMPSYERMRLNLTVDVDEPRPRALPRCALCGRDGCDIDARERRRWQKLGRAA